MRLEPTNSSVRQIARETGIMYLNLSETGNQETNKKTKNINTQQESTAIQYQQRHYAYI